MIQDMEANLAKRPTLGGIAQRKEYDAMYDVLQKKGQEVLKDSTLQSEATVGRKIKQGMVA